MSAPKYIDKIKDAAGVEGAAIVHSSEFLGDSQETIEAFQRGVPLAKLYAGKKEPPNEDRIRQDAEDYARLIHFQLEILLLRHVLYQNNATTVKDEQRTALLEDVRQLLFQKEVITHYLAKGADPKDMPTWDSGDLESKEAATRFLARNAAGRWDSMHLQSLPTADRDDGETRRAAAEFLERDTTRRRYGAPGRPPHPQGRPALSLIEGGPVQ